MNDTEKQIEGIYLQLRLCQANCQFLSSTKPAVLRSECYIQSEYGAMTNPSLEAIRRASKLGEKLYVKSVICLAQYDDFSHQATMERRDLINEIKSLFLKNNLTFKWKAGNTMGFEGDKY